MCPDAISRIIKQLETMRGGIVGLIGLQGVGKSNALYAIYAARINAQDRARREAPKIDTHGVRLEEDYDMILFKGVDIRNCLQVCYVGLMKLLPISGSST